MRSIRLHVGAIPPVEHWTDLDSKGVGDPQRTVEIPSLALDQGLHAGGQEPGLMCQALRIPARRSASASSTSRNCSVNARCEVDVIGITLEEQEATAGLRERGVIQEDGEQAVVDPTGEITHRHELRVALSVGSGG